MNLTKLLLTCSLPLLVVACGGSTESVDAGGDTPVVDDGGTTTTEAPDGGRLMPGADVAIGTIEITVTHPTIEPLVYTIGCLGDAFPVTPEVAGVDGATACALLNDDALLSRLVDGPPADQMCTEIYGGDDMAVITGEIDSKPIDATVTRANGCEIDTWDSLVGLLPPAIGVTG